MAETTTPIVRVRTTFLRCTPCEFNGKNVDGQPAHFPIPDGDVVLCGADA